MIEVRVAVIHCLSCGAREVPGIEIRITPDRNASATFCTDVCHQCRRKLFVKLLQIGTDIQT